MSNEVVIKVENISKKYCRFLRHVMAYGVIDITRDFLGLKTNSEKLRAGEFWAVKDVSFEVKKGETLGLIGFNGAGKTTLLKMLNGIFMPDQGKISIHGRVGALIELGAGFHPLLTGRENIYINGAILGMNKVEIEKKMDSIIDFAGIGDFLDAPLKSYSSGMFVRLGFAIAVHCEPDILLIDEILSVGDYKFQQKAFSRLEDYRQKGVPTVLVSHNLHTIRFMCDIVMVLDKGKIKFMGDANKAIQTYQALAGEDISIREQFGLNKGSNLVKIRNVNFFDINDAKRNIFHSDEGMVVNVEYFSEAKIENLIFQFGIFRDDGLPCYGGNTAMKNIDIKYIEGKGSFKIKINRLHLTSGNYIMGFVFFNKSMTGPYGADTMGDFVVVSDYPRTGKSCPAFSIDYEWLELTNEG